MIRKVPQDIARPIGNQKQIELAQSKKPVTKIKDCKYIKKQIGENTMNVQNTYSKGKSSHPISQWQIVPSIRRSMSIYKKIEDCSITEINNQSGKAKTTTVSRVTTQWTLQNKRPDNK